MLTVLCIICIFITLYLLYYSKTSDKYVLLISLIGQLLMLYGSIYKNNYILEICHILFWIVILYFTFFCKEYYILLFILLCVIVALITRLYYNDCLFLIENNNTEIIDYTKINVNVNKCCIILILIIIFRLYINQSHL